jgi:hypothetical protein
MFVLRLAGSRGMGSPLGLLLLVAVSGFWAGLGGAGDFCPLIRPDLPGAGSGCSRISAAKSVEAARTAKVVYPGHDPRMIERKECDPDKLKSPMHPVVAPASQFSKTESEVPRVM